MRAVVAPAPPGSRGDAKKTRGPGRPARGESGDLRHFLPLILTAALGLAGTGAAYEIARLWQAERDAAQFERLAGDRRQDLQRTINASLEVLHSLASYFRGSQIVEREEFRTFVDDPLRRHPEIYSLQWRPRVLADERAAFEARERGKGSASYQIRDATLAGRLVRAGLRPEYFPVLYAEPLEPSRPMLGLDRTNEPERRKLTERTLRRAGRGAIPSASGGVRLSELASDARDPYAILVNLPVYRHGAAPEGEAERLRALAGFVVAVYRVGGLLEAALRRDRLAGMDIAIVDESPDLPAELLYYRPAKRVARLEPGDWTRHTGLRSTGTVRIADRKLTLVSLARRDPAPDALAFWAAGTVLVLFSAIGASLWSSLRHTREIQGLVVDRGREIEERQRSERTLRRAEARLQRQNLCLTELASESFIRYRRLGDAFRTLTVRVAETLEVERTSVWRFTDGEGSIGRFGAIECLHLYERDLDRHSAGGTISAAECPAYFTALCEGRVVAVDDALADPRTCELNAYLAPLGVSSMLDAPVRLGDAVVAIICCEHTGPARRWTVDEEVFAGSVADLASLALQVFQHDRAQRALARSEERYRSLVDATTNVVGIVSRSGEVVEHTASWETFTGQGEADGRGMGYLAALHPEDRPLVLPAFWEAADRSPAVYEADVRVRRHDGIYRLLHYRAVPVLETDGGIREWVVAGTDVTEARAAERVLAEAHRALEVRVAERTRELALANERLKELDRLKSEFLATMSHELRTPLNSIIGFTGILTQGIAGPLNPEQHKQLSMVYGSAKHLLALISDLLDLSRIESGRMEIALGPVQLPEVVGEVMQVLGPSAGQKAIALVRVMPDDLPEIHSDRKKIFQILLNLASNAVKFTARGEVRIIGRTDGDGVALSVLDTGIGIKPENMGFLFEAFRQIEGSAERRYEGAGLGLHLSLRLARLLGGDIRAESTYGRGSRFTLTLPARASGENGGEPQGVSSS